MKRLLCSIRHWWDNKITKHHFNLIKEAAQGYPYDPCYLLRLEQAKLKAMLSYMERSEIVDHTNNIKWIKICINLLDIIIEEPEIDPKLINTRNCLRFSIKHRSSPEKVINYYKRWPNDLRWLKANYLYYEIRKLYTSHWWD